MGKKIELNASVSYRTHIHTHTKNAHALRADILRLTAGSVHSFPLNFTMQNAPCYIHRAQMKCIDMARLCSILKETRILTTRLVGGAELTYRNGHGAGDIDMYRTMCTIFVSNNTAR